MTRRKVTGLGSYAIRSVRSGSHGQLYLKLHSHVAKRTRWVSIAADSLFDEDGNHFEDNAPFMPDDDYLAEVAKTR